jgi:hypothetical protein
MKDPVKAERKRCVGLVLEAVGRLKLAGYTEAAKIVDNVALVLEHPELVDKVSR